MWIRALAGGAALLVSVSIALLIRQNLHLKRQIAITMSGAPANSRALARGDSIVSLALFEEATSGVPVAAASLLDEGVTIFYLYLGGCDPCAAELPRWKHYLELAPEQESKVVFVACNRESNDSEISQLVGRGVRSVILGKSSPLR